MRFRFHPARVALVACAFFAGGCATAPPPVNFLGDLAKHPQSGAVIEGVPNGSPIAVLQGHDALASVLAFWGHPVPVQAIARQTELDSRALEYEEALMLQADRQGLWTFATYGNIAMLQTRVAHGVPVIVELQRNSSERRFAVVVGYDEAEKRVLCNEGGAEQTVYSYTEFMTKWIPVRSWMLLIAPPSQPTWELSPAELATRARFYESRNELDLALADVKTAMAVDPINSRLCVNAGNLYRAMGAFDKAEGMYRRAIDLNPAEGQAFNNLAYLKAERGGDLDEAESLAKSALLLEPTNPIALDTLGFILCKRGQFAEAVPHLEQAHARARQMHAAKQDEIAVHLARAYLGSARPDQAGRIVAETLAADPSFAVPDDLREFIPKPASH